MVVQRQAGKQGLIVLMMDRIAVSSPSAPARPRPADTVRRSPGASKWNPRPERKWRPRDVRSGPETAAKSVWMCAVMRDGLALPLLQRTYDYITRIFGACDRHR